MKNRKGWAKGLTFKDVLHRLLDVRLQKPKDKLEEYLEKVHAEPEILESEAESKRSVASMRTWARV